MKGWSCLFLRCKCFLHNIVWHLCSLKQSNVPTQREAIHMEKSVSSINTSYLILQVLLHPRYLCKTIKECYSYRKKHRWIGNTWKFWILIVPGIYLHQTTKDKSKRRNFCCIFAPIFAQMFSLLVALKIVKHQKFVPVKESLH